MPIIPYNNVLIYQFNEDLVYVNTKCFLPEINKLGLINNATEEPSPLSHTKSTMHTHGAFFTNGGR
jgi:hypothetical protein